MGTIKQNEIDFIKEFDKFLKKSSAGKRIQKNGKKISSSTIDTYSCVRKILVDFIVNKKFHLRIKNVRTMRARELDAERNYWKKFYIQFANYLYDDCDYYDNYVGTCIKCLKTFFNYLNKETSIMVGAFHKDFYVPSENIEIITISPEQLLFLIHNKEFENTLPNYLKDTKDMFVFGCTVALRYSDLIKLNSHNLEKVNDKWYIKASSQKTNTKTSVLLPDYAKMILNKSNPKQKTYFKALSKDRFNDNLKELIMRAGWNEIRPKTRRKRGVDTIIYKNPKKKELHRFSDLISSHTMRRTAITTMLCLEMPETIVRKISGHAPHSKEFFRYLEISQRYLDTETEKMHSKLEQKLLSI
jgi:hypothetical protein